MPTGVEVTTADVRASDRERERSASRLRDHAGEGRLDVDELAERLDRAYAARTRAELDALTADLPDADPAEGGSRPTPVRPHPGRGDLRGQVTAFVAVNVLLVAVWAVTGAGYFWPVWPMLGWGIGLASHGSRTAFGGRFASGGHCGHRRASHRAAA
jgi:hypothetical protein